MPLRHPAVTAAAMQAVWKFGAVFMQVSGALLEAYCPVADFRGGCYSAAPQFENSRRRAMIKPGAMFKDNLQQLPAIDGVQRVDLVDAGGEVVASIENQPGKQGSLAVYQYLKQQFGVLDSKAAEHGLAVFGEHTADARERAGAHPNIDRLLSIAAGGPELNIEVIAG